MVHDVKADLYGTVNCNFITIFFVFIDDYKGIVFQWNPWTKVKLIALTKDIKI